MTLLRQFDDLIYITARYEVFTIKTHSNSEYLAALLDVDANPVTRDLWSLQASFPFSPAKPKSEGPPYTKMV